MQSPIFSSDFSPESFGFNKGEMQTEAVFGYNFLYAPFAESKWGKMAELEKKSFPLMYEMGGLFLPFLGKGSQSCW